ncbi:MAG TPA: cation transporter [Candidatus Deferrimicrobiaceae bacterium]
MGELSKIELIVRDMTCGHCVMAVKKSLSSLQGVSSVELTLDPPRARMIIDPDMVSTDALVAATTAEGYPSSVVR